MFITTSLIKSNAQELFEQKYFPGAYFAYMVDPIYDETTSDSINLHSQYLNVNFRYALNRVWRVGAEYILTFISSDEVDDPFSTIGLTMDYDILRAKRSKLHLRAGLSFSNFNFLTEGLPEKRSVVNRVFGGSYEYRLNNVLWVYGGLYHHFPLNKIDYKDAMIQPFIGVCVGM
jgi:hypothetical protein